MAGFRCSMNAFLGEGDLLALHLLFMAKNSVVICAIIANIMSGKCRNAFEMKIPMKKKIISTPQVVGFSS